MKNITKKEVTLEEEDIDLDGEREVLLSNKDLICCFSQKGGTLLELSLRQPPVNILNTITRREESYHKKVRKNVKKQSPVASIHDVISSKEEGLDKFLIYDKYERLGLVDHLLDKNLTLDGFNCQSGVTSLSNKVYALEVKKSKKGFGLNYRCQDKDLSFLKKIEFSNSSGFDAAYKFSKRNALKICNFGIEFNLSLPSLKDIFAKSDGSNVSLCQTKSWRNLNCFLITDNQKKISLEFKHTGCDIFTLPLYSVASSESGFEKAYQQITLLFIFKGKKDNINISLRVKKL